MKPPQLCSPQEFDERWLEPGAVVPVIPPNLGATLREVQRLRQFISEEQTRHAELRTAAQAVFDSSESGTKPPIMAALRKLAAVMGLEVAK